MGDDGPALNFRNALPLNEHLSVEFDGMLQLPEAAYTTQRGGKICLGVGDFKVSVKEINILAEM